MSVLKRKNLAEQHEKCHATQHSHLKSRRRLNVIVFAVVATAAILMSGQLRSLKHVDLTGYFGSSHFGDNVSDGEEFDYIVVGAGAAGSAVAARLALAGRRVLLVEAGGDPNLLSRIPGTALTLTGSSLDWYYDTQSNNKSCLASKEQRCRFTRGRCLGGSTSINYMIYTRGNRQDYNFNLPGWTWEDIKPYFLRYEGLHNLELLPKSSAPYHNTSGFVPIGYFSDSGNPWHERIIDGLKSLNFPYNPDVNAESQIGVSQVLGFTQGGERVSTANAYLGRKNVKRKLRIAKNTQCTGVIIDENNVARGVTVYRGVNETLRLFAKHEVIISAGTIGTAQLLMLSGIGPKEHLKELGISVKADLPVGEEMTDHVLSVLYINVDYDYRAFLSPLNIVSKGIEFLQWFGAKSGPLSSNSLTDVTTFVNTKCYNYTLRRLVNDRPECKIPSSQYIYAYMDKGIGVIARTFFEKVIPNVKEIWDQILLENNENGYIVVTPKVLLPKSRGWLRLASSDPLVEPIISPNYLSEKSDVEEMVRAIKILEQLVETPLFKRYNASILRLNIPNCPGIKDDGYWECYARHMTHPAHHATGTAALGRVVDERLRVKGVKNLRVADASVLPRPPRGNTAAAIIAIGERLSDFLIQDQRLV